MAFQSNAFQSVAFQMGTVEHHYYGIGHYKQELRKLEEARNRKIGVASKRTRTDLMMRLIDAMEQGFEPPPP